jgi:hypothetical protein
VNRLLEFSTDPQKGCMKWLVSKADPLQSSTPKTASFEIPQTAAEGQPRVYDVKIFAWNANNPPERETDGMYEVCILSVDLTKIPPEALASKSDPAGKTFQIVNCQIEIKIEGSMLEFRVLVGEQECCKVLGRDM